MSEENTVSWSGPCRVLEPVNGKWNYVNADEREADIQVDTDERLIDVVINECSPRWCGRSWSRDGV